MKTQLIILILSFFLHSGYCQDPSLPSDRGLIVLQNNKKIKSARLWKIDDSKVEYELNGSLHDIQIDLIKVIKLENEIVEFDIEGQIEIRPYDLIIIQGDTIKCTITRTTSGNIYFYKQKGFRKPEYISRSMVDRLYEHPEDLIFRSFQEEYITFIISTTQIDNSTEVTEELAYTQEDEQDTEGEEGENDMFDEDDLPIYETTLQPPKARRVIGQVLLGVTFGAVGAATGATVGGLVGVMIGSTGNAALVGAGLVGAAALGIGTGLGVSVVGDEKNVKGKFGKAVGGAYLGLLGSVVIAVITGGSGIGLVLAAISPAVASTIAFTKSRRLKRDLHASHPIENNENPRHL